MNSSKFGDTIKKNEPNGIDSFDSSKWGEDILCFLSAADIAHRVFEQALDAFDVLHDLEIRVVKHTDSSVIATISTINDAVHENQKFIVTIVKMQQNKISHTLIFFFQGYKIDSDKFV